MLPLVWSKTKWLSQTECSRRKSYMNRTIFGCWQRNMQIAIDQISWLFQVPPFLPTQAPCCSVCMKRELSGLPLLESGVLSAKLASWWCRICLGTLFFGRKDIRDFLEKLVAGGSDILIFLMDIDLWKGNPSITIRKFSPDAMALFFIQTKIHFFFATQGPVPLGRSKDLSIESEGTNRSDWKTS